MLSNDAEYEDGLRFFEVSFNRTRNIDTPMELEVIRVSSEQFFQLGWRAKIVYALKSLRYERPDPLRCSMPLQGDLWQHPMLAMVRISCPDAPMLRR